VAADQAMVSVETDKAIVDIPAPYAGRIEKLFAKPGESVHVGAPLVGFEGQAEDRGAVVGELAAAGTVPAARPISAAPAAAATRTEPAMRGMRRTMARNMAAAHAEVASVTIMDDADVESWPAGTPLMPRLVRALLAGCRTEPGLNAWYDGRANARQVHAEVHLGIAVDTADGLLVPVLRDCQKLDAAQLDATLEALVRDARERKLPPAMLRGATITLSNHGSIAGRYASPIVLPPTIAILGAGKLAKRAVVAGGALAAHWILPLSLTFDHRAATGGEAGRFLNAVISDLERAP
jgi:pyruvate dehydrogenase E2 component (dihydrolipoamide acetyltransferase)